MQIFQVTHFEASCLHQKDWNYELRPAIVFQGIRLFHPRMHCFLIGDTQQLRRNQLVIVITTAIAVVVIIVTKESTIILVDVANVTTEAN